MSRFRSRINGYFVVSLSSGASVYSPDFPRFGRYDIGAHNYDNSTVKAFFAKNHIVVHNGWDGWEGGFSQTMAAWQADVRAASSVGTQKFLYYTDSTQVQKTGTAHAALRTAASSGNWLLRATYPAGATVDNFYTSAANTLNVFNGGTSVSGLSTMQWRHAWEKDYIFNGNAGGFATSSNTANPTQDGVFRDDLFGRLPQANGDWNRDGTTDVTTTDATLCAAFRTGMNVHFSAFVADYPTKMQFANLANGYDSTHRTELSDFNQVLDGGVMEHALGGTTGLTGGNTDEQNGWSAFITKYNWAEDLCKGAKAVLVCHNGVTATGTDTIDATTYRASRFGLAATVVHGDGYYCPNTASYSPSSNAVLEFDEYVGGALNDRSWMGTAVDARQTTAWSNGVYKRQFTNALVLLNPPGNGTQSVTPPAGWKRLTGTQDSTTNSGASVSGSISMPARTAQFFIPDVGGPAAVNLNNKAGFASSATTTAIDATAYTKFYVVLIWDTSNFTSIADSHGNTYTQVGTEATSANGSKMRRYLCEAGVGDASHTFTLTLTGAGSYAIYPMALTGCAATALDQAASLNDDSASPYISNSATTTQASELLISAISTEGGSAGTTHTDSLGFGVLAEFTDGTSQLTCAVGTRAVSSTGTYNSSWTTGAAVSAGLVSLDTFKAA